MKKIVHITKKLTFMLAVVMMLSNISALTAHAVILLSPFMTQTEDGRIKIDPQWLGPVMSTDSNGSEWCDSYYGYPFRYYTEEYEVDKFWGTIIQHNLYLDCYLTDYIKSHDASEWPNFVIKGSDGIPFYYSEYTATHDNYVDTYGYYNYYYVKYCYDEASGWWLQDKAYIGPYADGWGTGRYVETVAIEDLIKETKADIENGKEVNGKAEEPIPPALMDRVIDTENPKTDEDDKPSEPEIKDPYADVNTLGATVTLRTDCIKVKKNNAAQKPMPKSVKIGKTSLKKNKNFTVSYEKYENGWNAVDAVTDEGIYRLVVTGQNGYDGVYKKRLYVTADKTVKAMSSASVKVNKMSYAGEPITSGVIKSVKVGGRTLTEGTDYTVRYTNNTEAGTAQVTLTAVEGKGILGTKTVNFQITENKLSKAKVKGLSPVTYDPNKDMVQDMSKVTLTYGTKTLKEDTDFTVTYTKNTKVGTAKITFTGKGIYNGTLTKTFKITKALLSENMLDDASKNIQMAYTGKALKPEVILKNGNTMLVKGTDYTLAYSNNAKMSTDAKPAQITVKGIGNYAGSFKVPFMIVSDSNETIKTNNINAKDDAESAADDDTALEEAVTEEAISEEAVTEEPVSSEEEAASEEESVSEEAVTEEPASPEEESASDGKSVSEEIAEDTASSFIAAEEEPSGEEAITGEAFSEESAAMDDPTDENSDDPTELTEVVDDTIDEPDFFKEQETGESGDDVGADESEESGGIAQSVSENTDISF